MIIHFAEKKKSSYEIFAISPTPTRNQ